MDYGLIVCDTVTYCTGAPVSIVSSDMEIVADYDWQITTIAGEPYEGDAIQTTTSSMVDLTFVGEGLYEVCLISVSSTCNSWVGSLCTIIETSDDVPRVGDEFFDDQIICEGTIATFDIDLVADQDPNNDGIPGWLAPPQIFGLGTNTAIIPTPGCNYPQEITIVETQPSPLGQINETICLDDLPYSAGQGNVLTASTFATSNIFELDSILLTETTSLGCDSFVNVNIELLNIVDGRIEAISCTYLGIELRFEYDSQQSTSPIFLDFQWIDPSGNINLDIDAFVPSTPQIVGDLAVCSVGSTEAVYLATDDGTATIGFRWSWPDDVASAVVSGSRNEVITIDWTGSAGGVITAIALNTCAESAPTAVTISILDQPDAFFDFSSELCINELTSVTYTGDASQISEFAWNFGGAILVNGSTGVGPGPHFILFNSEGQKTIALTVTDHEGCISAEQIQTSEVDPLPMAPIINCNTYIDQVEFTWETVAGYNYDVQ